MDFSSQANNQTFIYQVQKKMSSLPVSRRRRIGIIIALLIVIHGVDSSSSSEIMEIPICTIFQFVHVSEVGIATSPKHEHVCCEGG